MVLLLDSTGKYTYVNNKCYELLGYEPAEMVGRPATDFAAAEDIPHVQLALQDAMLNYESVMVQIRVRTKQDDLVPMRGVALRIDDPDDAENFYMAGWVER